MPDKPDIHEDEHETPLPPPGFKQPLVGATEPVATITQGTGGTTYTSFSDGVLHYATAESADAQMGVTVMFKDLDLAKAACDRAVEILIRGVKL